MAVTHQRWWSKQWGLDDVDDAIDSGNVPGQELPLVHQFTVLRGTNKKDILKGNGIWFVF